MRVLLSIVLIFILHDFVIGKSIVKRQCNSCCSGGGCTSNCNNCCTTSNCYSNCNNCQNCGNNCKECPKNCDSDDTEPVPVLVPFPPAQISQPSSPSSNTNNNSYNFTADITLTNKINTVNNISIPIHINSTNENKVFVYPSASNYSVNPVVNNKCCIVMYPRTCDATGCYIRRQWECSSICTSEIVIIPVPTLPPPSPTPPPPQPCPQPIPNVPCQHYIPSYPFYQQQSSCQHGAIYPYYQCGNQQFTNCAGCYYCNGVYNPQQCAFGPSCPSPCQIVG